MHCLITLSVETQKQHSETRVGGISLTSISLGFFFQFNFLHAPIKKGIYLLICLLLHVKKCKDLPC